MRYCIFSDYGLSPLYGGWEAAAQRLMTKYVKQGAVVYDIGANYGIHTLLMAKLVGSSGRVYAFEPVPRILSQLKKNIELNSFSNVTCFNLALSNSIASADFFSGQHDGAGHLAEVGDVIGEKITVDTTTLDQFVFKDHERRPNFIKMDVEGAESAVLSGGEKVLQTYRPLLLIDLHNPEQDVAVAQILLKHGYQAYRTESGEKVQDLTKGWPNPSGLWGEIIAFPRTISA